MEFRALNERNIPAFDKSTIQKIVKLIVDTGIKNQWESDVIAKTITNEVMRLAINTNLVRVEK